MSMEPFNQLVGPLQIYVAPTGESVPAVDTTPAGNWTLLGTTDGGQKLKHGGALTKFYDDDHQGPVKATRPQEDPIVTFKIVDLDLETYARVMDRAADIVTASGPPATKRMPLKRGATPYEYAMLLRGTAASPYGSLPGMYVVPRGVFDGEMEPAFMKDERAELDCEFAILEDDDQSDADRLGWLIVQTS